MKLKTTSIQQRGSLTQHQRLQQEYTEYKRYSKYGDNCDGDYCNQCPDLGAEDCICDIFKYLKSK